MIARGTPFWDAGVDGSSQVVGDMDSGMDVDTILLSNTATDAGTPGPSQPQGARLHRLRRRPDDVQRVGVGRIHARDEHRPMCRREPERFRAGRILDGVAKKAKIVFQDIQVTSNINCLLGQLSPPASFVGMYDQVRSLGGHLTNGSFSACSGYGSYANEADQYTWDHKDFLMSFSAGNGGNGLVCPGTAKNVIGRGRPLSGPVPGILRLDRARAFEPDGTPR